MGCDPRRGLDATALRLPLLILGCILSDSGVGVGVGGSGGAGGSGVRLVLGRLREGSVQPVLDAEGVGQSQLLGKIGRNLELRVSSYPAQLSIVAAAATGPLVSSSSRHSRKSQPAVSIEVTRLTQSRP